MLVIGRAQLLRRGRWLAYMIALLGFIAAVLTLSRDGVTALAVGIAAALWVLPEKPVAKFFMRAAALTLPVVAWYAVDVIQAQRAQVNAQVYENVDTRFGLWSLAWKAFLDSPFSGSGWEHFRTISANLEQQTFAHNLFLSYLQIGGLVFGLPLVIMLIRLWIRSSRRFRPIGPALLALFAISQTDPYTEGSVGGITVWLVVAFAFALPAWARTDQSDVSSEPEDDASPKKARMGRSPGRVFYPLSERPNRNHRGYLAPRRATTRSR